MTQIAHSQAQALAKIKEQYFDVIITDLMLEKPNGGIEILKAVKKETNETEVIVITANNSARLPSVPPKVLNSAESTAISNGDSMRNSASPACWATVRKCLLLRL
jgi:CheY-like chemotaxis protein